MSSLFLAFGSTTRYLYSPTLLSRTQIVELPAFSKITASPALIVMVFGEAPGDWKFNHN